MDYLFGYARFGDYALQPPPGTMWQQFPLQPDGLRNSYLTATQWEIAEQMDREREYWRRERERARAIIAQWSEWEQQTRNPAWR